MIDEVAKFNRERWEALVKANVRYSRPALNLDAQSARDLVDPEGMMGQCRGRDVLCLAGGGGQQSAAFGLLGPMSRWLTSALGSWNAIVRRRPTMA